MSAVSCPMSGAVTAPAARVTGQALIVGGSVAAYFLVRGLTEADPGVAVGNAADLVAVERSLGIAWEGSLQESVVRSEAATTLVNWVYIWGHWPLIAVTLWWLATRHLAVFTRVRNAMLGSGAIGLVVFATVPVAPPRLAGLGLVDTVTAQSHAYRVLQPAGFTNQYAALPSLHVGWNLLIGLAIATAVHRRWVRILGLTVPVAMVAAVVRTANHYLIDVVAGLVLAGAAWGVAGWWRHRGASRPGRGDHRMRTVTRPDAAADDEAARTGLRGLVVDWGGVLTSALEVSMARWAESDDIDYEGFRAAMREWLGPEGGQIADRNPLFALERGEVEVPHFEEQLAARLTTRSGGPVPGAGLLDRMFEHFAHAPDMAGLVLRARRAGIRTALLSNSWGNDYPRDGWDDMFDAIVISGEVGMRKPEPRIFRHTVALLGLRPGECVFVDDLPVNVAAAVEVGLVGVHHTGYATSAAELEALFGIPLAE